MGIASGFENLLAAGRIAQLQQLAGVQAMACAPIWAAFHMGAAGLQWVTEKQTAAEGVRIRNPVRGDRVLQAVKASGGTMLAVEEDRIAPARDSLARMGLYVEPTAAIVWDALRQLRERGPLREPVVAVLTGSGLKSSV
jgi:threonine synthase